jgi:putative PIN family toxin of toxin-antitoxin system
VIRALLDTNVLASGIVGFADAERTPARLLRLWREQRFNLVVSPGILIELHKTLEGQYFRQQLTSDQITAARRLLHEEAESTPLSVRVSGVATHAEDDLVLSAAISAGVDYMVTGDKQLQRLGDYQGVSILSPRAFLDLLEELEEEQEEPSW